MLMKMNELVSHFQQILTALDKIGALEARSPYPSAQRPELECAHAALQRAALHAHTAIWTGFSECMGYDTQGSE